MTRLDWIIKIGGKEYWMDSPVEHFMLLLRAAFQQSATSGMSTATCHDTSNTSRSTLGCNWQSGNYRQWMGVGQPAATNDNYGILVGSNNTAVDITDYAMNTKISHGVAAGNLQYGAQTAAYGGATPNKYAKIMRTFTNGTANPVDIGECGIVGGVYDSAGTLRYILLTRDIFDPEVSVAAGDTCPIEIYIQTTC
jgi:hypothetical protein